MSASNTWLHPALAVSRMVSSASSGLRLGRKPKLQGRKSASKMGSNTNFAAACATLSFTVGMPSGRCRPFAFGMYRLSTGGGAYVPARSSS